MIRLSDEIDGLPYEVLEPILDLLLNNGNELARDYRWGCNRSGYFCILKQKIDFELIEKTFQLPDTVELMPKYGIVSYGLGSAEIRYG